LNDYQFKTEVIRVNINKLEILLKEREDIIKVNGYSNNERILKDNKFKDLRTETESNLKELKDVFKKFTEKNKNKLAPHELDLMSKNIDLL